MRLISQDGLKEKGISFCSAWLWKLIRQKRFPAPVKIGENRNAWLESEIDSYIAQKIKERDEAAKKPASTEETPRMKAWKALPPEKRGGRKRKRPRKA